MFSESVKEQGILNNLKAPVDIKSYTASNKYTIPADGYIRCGIKGNAAGRVVVVGNNDDTTSNYLMVGSSGVINTSSDTILRFSTFVRKGMKAYVIGDIGDALFIELI